MPGGVIPPHVGRPVGRIRVDITSTVALPRPCRGSYPSAAIGFTCTNRIVLMRTRIEPVILMSFGVSWIQRVSAVTLVLAASHARRPVWKLEVNNYLGLFLIPFERILPARTDSFSQRFRNLAPNLHDHSALAALGGSINKQFGHLEKAIGRIEGGPLVIAHGENLQNSSAKIIAPAGSSKRGEAAPYSLVGTLKFRFVS